MQKIKLSHSQIELYNECPKKYYFRYKLNLKADETRTPLLFGIALDNALNYILESIRDKKEYSVDHAKEIFITRMSDWKGQNRLDFFKNEVPDELKENYNENDPEVQEAVWDNITKRGLNCIDVYTKEFIPLIHEVLSVQNKFEIENEEGYKFTGVIDFIAKLKDGRTVLFDNKSASQKYPKNKVVTSQQLSLYIEQFPELEFAGYVVLIKNPAREKGMKIQIMVDKIPEETRAAAFKKLDDTLVKIANEEFACNTKKCMAFGKPCEYERLCKWNDDTGLVPAYEKKENKE